MPILSEEDLERFRTKVCTLASSMKCDFGVERCNYSHNLYWARRCPFYLRDSTILRYIPACCPDVELGESTTVLRNTCPRGNNCSFAHSWEEINYHPLVYKTEICKDYRLGKCKTYYCHLVHGLAEFRVPREFVLPKKRGLEIPHFEHVTLVENIRSVQCNTNAYQKERYVKLYPRESLALPTERELMDLDTGWSIRWSRDFRNFSKSTPDEHFFAQDEAGADGIEQWYTRAAAALDRNPAISTGTSGPAGQTFGTACQPCGHPGGPRQALVVRKPSGGRIEGQEIMGLGQYDSGTTKTTWTPQSSQDDILQDPGYNAKSSGILRSIARQCDVIKALCAENANDSVWVPITRQARHLCQLALDLKNEQSRDVSLDNSALSCNLGSLYNQLMDTIDFERSIEEDAHTCNNLSSLSVG
ncbi:bifunctional RING finger protein Unkempt-like/Zinc finger [Babesia duncani]|uniref:Bifunctional RING finger protein Unkempt-like/Zinc finger n=1 Tax=Babesia duncani TaxID=323732 RepID=A0AAD9PL65_9APIC|nr:bifunctional RING finger protein Unkempt-like/Zinc finger [Babesia duncani]